MKINNYIGGKRSRLDPWRETGRGKGRLRGGDGPLRLPAPGAKQSRVASAPGATSRAPLLLPAPLAPTAQGALVSSYFIVNLHKEHVGETLTLF